MLDFYNKVCYNESMCMIIFAYQLQNQTEANNAGLGFPSLNEYAGIVM